MPRSDEDGGPCDEEFTLDQEDQERILQGFGFVTFVPVGDETLPVAAAADRIAAYAATIVKATQLLIVIVSTPEVAAYRSNLIGGPAAMPAVLRELAAKIPQVTT